MFIAILVLLGLAGAIWYFARKQAQAIVTLTQEDVAVPTQEQKDADLKEAQEAALKTVQESTKKVKTMIEKIDTVLAEVKPEPVVEEPVAPAVEPIAELPSENVKTEIAVDETPVEETYEITEEEFKSEVAAGSTDVTSEEVGNSKPVHKKKRRYYPKKK
jgi:hypothetical protein